MQIRPQAPRWNLIAHIDASSPDLEPNETREVDVMERAPRRGVDVTVQLRRTVTTRGEHLRSAVGHAAAAAFAGVASLGAAAAAVLALPPLVGLPIAALALRHGWKQGKEQFELAGMSKALASEGPLHDEPAWEGTRTFRLGKDVQPGRIDSPVVHESPDTATPEPRELGEFLGREMRRFPGARHAVMLSGHGMAWDNVVGLGMDQVGEALDHAKRVSGKKPDLLILESCLMGNVEALHALAGTARFAVVSEETMGADGLPWERILKAASKKDVSAEALGKAMVRLSPDEEGGVDTLGLVDLDRMPAVASAVEALGRSLQALASTWRSEIRDSFKQAEALPRGGAPGVEAGSLVDLGGLVRNLEARIADPAVHRATRAVRRALAEAVVAHKASSSYREGTEGLSIQAPVKGLDTSVYAETTGMTGWAGLLHELKPWYRRLFTS